MDLKLHANATTTPKTRAYIQASKRSTAEFARELGVTQRTVARWRSRSGVMGLSPAAPHRDHHDTAGGAPGGMGADS